MRDDNIVLIDKTIQNLIRIQEGDSPSDRVAGRIQFLFRQLKQRAIAQAHLPEETARRLVQVMDHPSIQSQLPSDWKRILFLSFPPSLAHSCFPELEFAKVAFSDRRLRTRHSTSDAMLRRLPGGLGPGKRR